MVDAGVVDTQMEFIDEFKIETAQAVKEAYLTPTTEMISQSLGSLIAKHEFMRQKMPAYLFGCVDSIYADGLYHLRRVALFQRDLGKTTKDELTYAIHSEYNRLDIAMKRRVNISERPKTADPADGHCTCKNGKKGSCQSPIMEA